MRGKDVAFDLCRLIIGITPAYAGKRNFFDFEVFKFEDHPRLCGEKLEKSLKFLYLAGSPPPMRGKVLEGADEQEGKRDHPRLCGEKYFYPVGLGW